MALNLNVLAQETWSERQNNSQLLLNNYREQLYQITRYNVINEIYSNKPYDKIRHDILLTLQDLKENNRFAFTHAEEVVDYYIGHSDITYLAYELGNKYFDDENYIKSEYYFSKVEMKLLRKREQYNVWFKRGYTSLLNKKYVEAIEFFAKIELENSPYFISAIYYSAFASSKIGDFKVALSLLFSIENNEEFGVEIPILISKIYLKKRDFDGLVKYSSKIPKKYMQDEELLLLVGEAYFHIKQYQKATEYYKKIKAIYVNDNDLSFRIGYSYFNIKDFKNALPFFMRVINTGEENSLYILQSKFYAGIINVYLKKYKKALIFLNFVIENENDNHGIIQRALYMKVLTLYNSNFFEKAATAYLHFIKSYPRSEYIDRKTGVFTKIIEHIDDPNVAYEYLRDVNNELKEQKLPIYNFLEQKLLIRLGHLSLVNADNESAYSYFIKAVKYIKNPYTVLAHLGMAETLFQFKRYQAAQTYYQYVYDNFTLLDESKYQKNEIWMSINYSIGYTYFNLHSYSKSASFFLESLKSLDRSVTPKNDIKFRIDAQLRLADCYYTLKKYIKAKELYLDVINNKNSKKSYVYYQLANIEAALENFDAAVNYFEKVMQFADNDEIRQQATFELGKFYFQQTKYDDSIEFFNKYITKCKDSHLKAKALLLRGIAYENKWDIANAEASFEEIIESHLETNQVEGAFNALRSLYIKQNKSKDLEHLTEIYKTVKHDEEGLKYIEYQTAMEYFNNKNFEKTIELLISFLNKNPNSSLNSEINKVLSDSYFGIQDINNAIKYFEKRSDLSNYKNQFKLATLYQNQQNYNKSNKWFDKVLNKDSISIDLTIKCFNGKLENYSQLNQFNRMQNLLDKLYKIKQDKNSLLPFSIKLSNHYLVSKQYVKLNNTLTLIQSLDKKNFGAHAYFLQVQALYNQKKYTDCIDKVKAFNKYPSPNEYWLGKAYIVMAQCFIKKNNGAQAIGILESIVENISNNDVKAEAQIMLDKLRPPINLKSN